MRIAQIAPLWERVPPLTYGGIELVVSLLTDELVRRGHEVTLFASGDSITLAKLDAVHPQALRLDQSVKEPFFYEMWQLGRVYEQATQFDIIHSHVGCATLPVAPLVSVPTVHTLHGVFTSDNEKLFTFARHQPYISISQTQREPRLGLNYLATVYNGIDLDSHQFHRQPQNPPYLAFLGRLSPEKGAHLAIAIAKRAGLPLRIAGKVDRVDQEYFAREIQPHLDGEQIQFLGEHNHAQKNALMGGAIATLFPITWREPFGLVMIESMAAGTPVIAMNLGAASEIIAHGQTGFLCQSLEECLVALQHVPGLERLACRQHVEQNFSVKRMVDGYEAVYNQILSQLSTPNSNALLSLTKS